jgi:hypothetical protein
MTPVEEAVYVASRASIPERPAMWQRLRKQGWNISSTWIDEAGEGETGSFSELWQRITDEIRRSAGVVLYVEPEDLPLKGAYIEIGMALGMGKPVAVVAHDMPLDARNFRPLGSWAMHPLVVLAKDLEAARQSVLARSACDGDGERPIAERTECRPYDGVEHSLVQDAADDALTLASFPNAGAATKFVHSGNELIRVRVSIHKNEKPGKG